MADKKVTRRISIFINDKEVKNSFYGINGAIRSTVSEMKKLDKSSDTYEEDMKRLKTQLGDLKERQSEFKEEIYGTNEATTSLSEVWDNLMTGFSTGNFELAKEGINGIGGAIKNTTKTALAFIATPIGAAIAVLAGIALATREWVKYNQEVRETNRELQALTNQSGKTLDTIRLRSKALAETFDVEVNETVRTADVLVKQFGITYEEAFDQIEDSLVRGQAKNEEFFDSIKEYSSFFSDAGYSVEEFRRLIEKGYDLNVYSDKLPDAIKEFNLSISEQTTATREALENAFGKEYTDQLFSNINTGTITVKDALASIAEESEKYELTRQQQAQLTADIFRGAGEDAGGFAKIIEIVNSSLNDQVEPLTEIEQGLQKIAEANRELAEAQDNALKSDNYEALATSLELFWVKIKTLFYDGVAYLGDLWADSVAFLGGFATALANIPTIASKSFATMQKSLTTFVIGTRDGFKSIGQFLTGNFDAAEESFNRFLDTSKNSKEIFKSAFTDAQNEISQAYVSGRDFIKIQLKATAEASKELNKESVADAQKTSNKRLNISADELNKQQEKAKNLADAKIRLAQAELEHWLLVNQTKLEDGERLTEALVQQEKERLAAEQKEREEFLELQYANDQKEIENAEISQEEKNAQKLALEQEYQNELLELNQEYREKEKENQDAWDEQLKAEKAERLGLEYELALANANTAAEEAAIREQKEYDDSLARYQQLLDNKKISDEEYAQFKAALDKKKAKVDRLREIEQTKTTLSAMGTLADALTQMFGQSKEMAIASALINGALAITNIWATTPKADFGVTTYLLLAANALATIASVKEITSQKAPKTPSFYYGGKTGKTAHLGYDQYGAVTGYVHANEYVVPEWQMQDPAVANVMNWVEARRQNRITGYYEGGPVTDTTGAQTSNFTESSSAPSQQEMSMLMSALSTLNTLLSNGIVAKVLFGYDDVQKLNNMNNDISNSNQNGRVS